MDLWVEQEWDGTLSSVINGSINKAWSRGTLQIYGFLSPPADAIMADRTECLSRGNWAGIMKKGKKKKKNKQSLVSIFIHWSELADRFE